MTIRRSMAFSVLVLVVGLGLAIQQWRTLPWADPAGTVLYVLAVASLVLIVRPALPPWAVAALAGAASLGVEALQLTAIPGSLTARLPLLRVVLGSTFSWIDVGWLLAGVPVAWSVSWLLRFRCRPRRHWMAGLGLALGVSWLTLPATLASTHLPGTLSWAPVVAGLSIVVVGLIDAWRGLSRDDTTPTPAALLVKLTAGLAIATLAGGAVAVLIGHVLPQPPPYRLVIMVAATLLLGAILTAVAGAGDGVPQRGRAAVAFIMATVTVALAASAGRGNLDDRDDRRVERPSAAVTTVMPTPYPAGPRHPVLRPVPVELTPAPDAPEDVPLCHRRQLTAWTQGWDSAMYQTAVAVVVANWADEPCAVAGLPSISLRQGGQQLDIVVSHRSVMAPGRLERPRRALVTAGGHVSVLLVWDGYRNQADQSTPQDLLLVVPGVADLAVRLDQGPAPFDLVAGGRISVSAWR